jgi:serine/threonine protein kinase
MVTRCEAQEPDPGEFLLAPGALVQGRYRVTVQLGKGGMGAVYQAVDTRLKTNVALKQMISNSEQLRKQFRREALLLARLGHSALPRVSDYFEEADRVFLVMEFIEGVDLAEIIVKQPGPFPRHQVIAWADQVLDAMIYLHSRDRQIIHRDIKPHNLKLRPSGQIAVLDFGLAKGRSTDSSSINFGSSVHGYTPRYAPLEQIQDLGTTPRSDIYALGATLYHLITGLKPPDALTRAAALVNSTPNPLILASEINRAVGPELAAILDRAMAQNPNDRYASATEFRDALRRLGRSPDTAASRQATSGLGSILGLEDGTATAPEVDDIFMERKPRSRALAAGVVTAMGLVFAISYVCYRWNLMSGLAAVTPDVVATASVDESAHLRDNRSGRAKPREKPVTAGRPEQPLGQPPGQPKVTGAERRISPTTRTLKAMPVENHKVVVDRARRLSVRSPKRLRRSIRPQPINAQMLESNEPLELADPLQNADKSAQDASNREGSVTQSTRHARRKARRWNYAGISSR